MKISSQLQSEFARLEKIEILQFREDVKSSEKYVDVIINQRDGFQWEGSIPFYYRRTGLFIENVEDLLIYLKSIKNYFTREYINNFKSKEIKYWKREKNKAHVTSEFFHELIKMEWTSNFPKNDNPQRRIQDIKERGYTLASRRVGKKYERLLLPIPKGPNVSYEVFTPEFKKKVFQVLKNENIYELSKKNIHGLIIDHKFPTIRWNSDTAENNHLNMSDEEIKDKFQLLDNQRNLQKREVCRNCFQTGKRGILYGIRFFYKGTDEWDPNIEKVGNLAESGCVGCGWYDLKVWRESLNTLIIDKVSKNI